jgi:alkanesulfonate monooxygenase SsuD/methylene tetrahydromethanopterin reductase-like flavin-dependent oxidoreductase (luciferase family)
MRFAMYVPNFDTFGSVHTLVALAQAAEAAGWDGFFLWDHLLPGADSAHGPVADPWIALTAIAGATSRLRLGALITPFPRRRPWKLVRETVTLDHYSAGRLVVGAGIGGDWWREYSAVGESRDDRTRGDMLDEGLDVVTGLWAGTPFTYKGSYYTVEDAQFLPPPYQTPRIPIWIAGVWPGTRPFRRAARWDGIIPTGRNGTPSPEDIRQMRAYINEYRKATTPFDVVFQGRAHDVPAEERVQHVTDYAAAGVTWWLEQVWPDVALTEVQSIIDQGPPSPLDCHRTEPPARAPGTQTVGRLVS